ncbi:hypothetical protein BIW11_02594 [Tropilaelaps mercedesae]|uniref:Uncharacterized protein n=1 Tax=Tropilaelaps mercedesae TaxID=418985 RepID=A0A1V9Y0I4_9ACAR|nr:hypothetical protein BIW11_02594 [Tropilaelaps mercedesae]
MSEMIGGNIYYLLEICRNLPHPQVDPTSIRPIILLPCMGDRNMGFNPNRSRGIRVQVQQKKKINPLTDENSRRHRVSVEVNFKEGTRAINCASCDISVGYPDQALLTSDI